MPASSGARKASRKPAPPGTGRLAAALGLPEERVARALDAAGASAQGLLGAMREGREEELQEVARAMRVERARLQAAVLEAADEASSFAGRAATAAEGVGAALRGTAEEALAIGLEIVAETIPRILNHVLAVLAAAGLALVALGLLAIFNTALFVQLLAVLAGLALIAAGIGLFTLAWRLHEATAALRTLARIARKWRERSAAREAGPGTDGAD
jgi:hypothetical protein